MEGRYPHGMVMAFVNCADASKEAEMNEWYNAVHVPDITRPGHVSNATRWANPGAKDTPEDPRYLALYETERRDVAAAWSETLAQRGQWRPWKPGAPTHPALKVVKLAVYQRLSGGSVPAQARRARGLLVAMLDCADPGREGEFNRWYDEVHIPDILATGLYWSGMRYVNTAPGPAQPRFLALYETERDGPAAFQALRGRLDASRQTKLSAVRYVGAFDLVFSQARAGARTVPR